VLQVNSGVTATLTGVTVSGGRTIMGGAGILSSGNLTILDSTITDNINTATGPGPASPGAGISSSGTLTIRRSTISDNHGKNTGGGISHSGGALEITDSAIINNTLVPTPPTPVIQGGGLVASSTSSILIKNSTFSGNNVTGNATRVGGGMVLGSAATLINVTISDNAADLGGGIRVNAPAGSVVMHNTIVAGNFNSARTAASDIFGNNLAATSSYNLVGTGGSGGLDPDLQNQLNVLNPGLAPLGDYGGPTKTHALLSFSTAIDRGRNDVAEAYDLDCDQRGFARRVDWPFAPGGSVDIGALELAVDEFYG
jgi:hypothetical protein